MGFSGRNKSPHCSAYDIGESNPVPASGLWSGSGWKVDKFVHVPTPVDTKNVIQIHARVLSNLANRQTDRQTYKHRGKSHLPPPFSEVKTALAVLYYLSNEAYYWQTRSIAWPLCDSRASCQTTITVRWVGWVLTLFYQPLHLASDCNLSVW